MDRRKFGASLTALVAGAMLWASSAWALTGYLQGDPFHGKLIPFYRVGPNLATIIGIESTEGGFSGPNVDHGDLALHVTIFSKRSTHIADFDLCLSPGDFGFIVLQQQAKTAAQANELFGPPGRFHKARVFSVAGDGIPTEGYVTIGTIAEFTSNNGGCGGAFLDRGFIEDHLATWAILQDIGAGFFATEVPTASANVSTTTGVVVRNGGPHPGLIPGPPATGTSDPFDGIPLIGTPAPNGSAPSNTVIARFDVNPAVGSVTEIFVWLMSNAFLVPNDPGSGVNRFTAILTGFLDCEDEFRVSATIPFPDEVNIINVDRDLKVVEQCKELGQYRGVLTFKMPDTGFLWSQISQESEHFRETFLGYNLDCNQFLDPSDCF